MVPTTADDALMAEYVANIVAAWNAATPDQVARGRAWYPVAHDLAELVGNGDVRVGAGIIAAFSPRKRWEENQRLAIDAHNGDIHGHFKHALSAVHRIIDGAAPETVLPMDAKTGHFFRNIVDPTDPDPVTIDCWAYRVATGHWDKSENPGLSNKARYATLALAYRLAARQLGEIPSVVQAATWAWAHETD